MSNVSAYLNNCFKNSGNYHAGILRDIFRNGLAHEYFARGGVARDGINKALYRGYNNEVILDADTLLEDFLASLDVFRDKLQDDMFESRIKLAEQSIKKWEEQYRDEIAKLPSISDMPQARTSGASIYAGTLNFTRPYDPNEK